VKFVIKSRPFRHLAQGAADTALDAASVLREGAAAVGRQGEAAYSRLRLEREIHDLQEEINLQLLAVGESIYAAHRGSPSDSGQVQQILEYVDGLREELEAHRRERDTLRGLLICPACGGANRSDCLYCQECGKALSRG
jgi:hypothetical protein